MKLHLGCGKKILPGYINVDATCGDVVGDIRDLSAYAYNSADEILAVHVWEHFWLNEVLDIAKEWHRALKPGGKLILEMPCKDKVFMLIKAGYANNENLTLWAMYGDPSSIRSEQDLHKWLWSFNDIHSVLAKVGFRRIEMLDPQYHVSIRDMRVEAIK